METCEQIVAGVFRLLRRPSDIKLPPKDVLEVINDLVKGYVHDLNFSREQRTITGEATLDAMDGDYLVAVPNAPDFEPMSLEYSQVASGVEAWREVDVIPISAWRQHFTGQRVVASFYGHTALQPGLKVRINLDPIDVGNRQWRVSYRLPLLTLLQEGDRPPLPVQHLPMLKHEAAIHCMPIVADDSETWRDWTERTLPAYTAFVIQDKLRWREYLDTSTEPTIQPLVRFDRFRHQPYRGKRAYLPLE